MTERKLRQDEIGFMHILLNGTLYGEKLLPLVDHCTVSDMDDGGMGGLTFISGNQDRKLSHDIASASFEDSDGVTVIATVSIDNYGDLYELDLFKTDFSKLDALPNRLKERLL
jgi:hypothetical protein